MNKIQLISMAPLPRWLKTFRFNVTAPNSPNSLFIRFLVGAALMALFCVIFVELLEKFDYVIINNQDPASDEAEASAGMRTSNFSKFRLRLTVGLVFTFTWVLARLLILMVIRVIE